MSSYKAWRDLLLSQFVDPIAKRWNVPFVVQQRGFHDQLSHKTLSEQASRMTVYVKYRIRNLDLERVFSVTYPNLWSEVS